MPRRKVAAALFWLLALGSYFYYSATHHLTPLETGKLIAEFVRTSAYGPWIFVLLYTFRPLFLFSAALLTIAAGAVFGAVKGLIYSVIGSNLGATLAFFIGRFFGEGLWETVNSESRLQRYSQRMREHSFETVFLMRLLFLPYDLVNYLAGILGINYWSFLAATVLGSIPGTLSFVLFGASSGLSSGKPHFDPRVLAASIAIFLLSLAVSKILGRRSPSEDKE